MLSKQKNARSDGFEPPSAVLETAKLTIVIRARFEPPMGIEPTSTVYETAVLPLNYGGLQKDSISSANRTRILNLGGSCSVH